MDVQILAAPTAARLGASPAPPGAVHDVRAAPESGIAHGLVRACVRCQSTGATPAGHGDSYADSDAVHSCDRPGSAVLALHLAGISCLTVRYRQAGPGVAIGVRAERVFDRRQDLRFSCHRRVLSVTATGPRRFR